MSKGIDIPIDKLVSAFNSNLWVANNTQYYGRCFRNQRFEDFGTTIAPEIFNGVDYIEVLKDDTKDATCFFDVQPEDTIELGTLHESIVWICFLVNLKAIYPSLTKNEATEQAHRDVQKIIESSQFTMTELVRGYVGFTGYDWGSEDVQAKSDKYPHYLFRFTTTLKFNNC